MPSRTAGLAAAFYRRPSDWQGNRWFPATTIRVGADEGTATAREDAAVPHAHPPYPAGWPAALFLFADRIDAGRMDPNQHFARSGYRPGGLFMNQYFRSTIGMYPYRFHIRHSALLGCPGKNDFDR